MQRHSKGSRIAARSGANSIGFEFSTVFSDPFGSSSLGESHLSPSNSVLVLLDSFTGVVVVDYKEESVHLTNKDGENIVVFTPYDSNQIGIYNADEPGYTQVSVENITSIDTKFSGQAGVSIIN